MSPWIVPILVLLSQGLELSAGHTSDKVRGRINGDGHGTQLSKEPTTRAVPPECPDDKMVQVQRCFKTFVHFGGLRAYTKTELNNYCRTCDKALQCAGIVLGLDKLFRCKADYVNEGIVYCETFCKDVNLDVVKCMHDTLGTFHALPVPCTSNTTAQYLKALSILDTFEVNALYRNVSMPTALLDPKGEKVYLQYLCKQYEYLICQIPAELKQRCGQGGVQLQKALLQAKYNIMPKNMDMKFTVDQCQSLGRLNEQGYLQDITQQEYYLSLVNPSLGPCHEHNLWMRAFACLFHYTDTMEFPDPSGTRNILTPAVCKGIPKLQECWKPLNETCPGMEFILYVDNVVSLLHHFCQLSQITTTCDITGILGRASSRWQHQHGQWCLNIVWKSIRYLIGKEMAYVMNPAVHAKVLHIFAEQGCPSVSNCTNDIYQIAQADLVNECSEDEFLLFQSVMTEFMTLVSKFPDFMEHILIHQLDNRLVMGGYVNLVDIGGFIAKLAVNYAAHGMLFSSIVSNQSVNVSITEA